MNKLFETLEKLGISKTMFCFLVLALIFLISVGIYQFNSSSGPKTTIKKESQILDSLYSQEHKLSVFHKKIEMYENAYQEENKGADDKAMPNINRITLSGAIEEKKKQDKIDNLEKQEYSDRLERISTNNNAYSSRIDEIGANNRVTPSRVAAPSNPQYEELERKINSRNNQEQKQEKTPAAAPVAANNLTTNFAASSNNANSTGNLIKATIHKTQVVKNNQPVVIRTTETLKINNISIPRNSLLIGLSSFGANRLQIKISTIKYANNLIPVNITIYGSDGIAGLPIQNNEIIQEVGNDAVDDVVNEVDNELSQLGILGKVTGGIIKQGSRLTANAENKEVKLIDNQQIFIKINNNN